MICLSGVFFFILLCDMMLEKSVMNGVLVCRILFVLLMEVIVIGVLLKKWLKWVDVMELDCWLLFRLVCLSMIVWLLFGVLLIVVEM